MLKKILAEKLKKLVFNYTSFGKPNYPYNLDPLQLSEIIISLEKVRNLNGAICEIGVARGMTTRFICEYLENIESQTVFYCLDTFNSFTEEDISFEIKNRKKTYSELLGFSYNNFDKWKKNFNNYNYIKPIQTDVKKFDFKKIKPIKFALLDVDLYLPTYTALENLKNNMITGGILMVDDVRKNNSWDGADQAFHEFVKKYSLNYELVGKKCGVIRF